MSQAEAQPRGIFIWPTIKPRRLEASSGYQAEASGGEASSGALDFGAPWCYTSSVVDGGVVVGYFSAWLLGRATSVANKKVEAALETLGQRALERLGLQRANQLRAAPHNLGIHQIAKRQIEAAMSEDQALRADLEYLVNYLDASGGRNIIIEPDYPRNPIVIGLIVVGIVLCVAGLGIFVHTFFQNSNYRGTGFPPGTETAFEIFFAGFGALALAGILHPFTKKKHH